MKTNSNILTIENYCSTQNWKAVGIIAEAYENAHGVKAYSTSELSLNEFILYSDFDKLAKNLFILYPNEYDIYTLLAKLCHYLEVGHGCDEWEYFFEAPSHMTAKATPSPKVIDFGYYGHLELATHITDAVSRIINVFFFEDNFIPAEEIQLMFKEVFEPLFTSRIGASMPILQMAKVIDDIMSDL